MQRARSSRVSTGALVLAVAYSAALVAAGFVVPLYSSASVSASGGVVMGSATLVDENGLAVLVVLSVPLLVSLLVAGALSLHAPPATALAWTLVALLALFTLLAMMSIGLLVLPVTIALVVACATAPRTSRGVRST